MAPFNPDEDNERQAEFEKDSAAYRLLRNFYNLLIDEGDDEIPSEWADADDDASEIGAALGEYDLASRIPNQAGNDTHRQHCLNYFINHGFIE